MDEPKSLDSLFNKKIFRIPDYQRGYAWQKSHLKDFWEDLVNLPDGRSHYTGVLTLTQIAPGKIEDIENEYWLIEDHSYKIYNVVDGQQRLTTFVIFLQALVDVIKQLPENEGKSHQDIYITASLNLENVISSYLFKTKPNDVQNPTYKFGYTVDNPSHNYLRYKIFNENGEPSIEETFYTLNLRNAKLYFYEQLKELHAESGMDGLQEIYKKLTKGFLFNEYVIKDEFDVFVAFETMNNRGKRLSDLELLKNRLIYLTTLYSDQELSVSERQELRDDINEAWKEVYFQLGRNEKQPLNDDDFLKAHWIMYFQYSRKKGNDYIKFLLDEQFSPQKIYEKIEREVSLDLPVERHTDLEMDDTDRANDDDNVSIVSNNKNIDISDATTKQQKKNKRQIAYLKPKDIKDYANSLKESSKYWFNSHYPRLAKELSEDEISAIEQLNRIGMGYFRPLLMAVFKNEEDEGARIDLLKQIERFIFIVFRLCRVQSNYGDSKFYNASREFNQGMLTINGIKQMLDDSSADYVQADGILKSEYLYNYLSNRFNNGEKKGYYGWKGLDHFLYEYELYLLTQNRQKKVSWEDLLKSPKDKISIEHIFPQTSTDNWQQSFEDIEEKNYHFFSGSIGNLLLLSMAINTALQNDDFQDKKESKHDHLGQKIRSGYSNGSHSEIEVSRYEKWTPAEIEARGLTLLNFMEERWGFKFKDEQTKKDLLFLPTVTPSEEK